MKRLFGIVTVIMLSAMVVTGCGTNPTQPANEPDNQTQTVQSAVDTSDFIGEAKAQEIALEKAEITADDVIFDRIELEREDGVWQYEVEFRKDLTEYDAQIKADDGAILSWEVDIDD